MNEESGERTAQGTVEHWYIRREVDADPSSASLTAPMPLPMPCLLLRAGSSKKECSGQSRSLWCEELLPACVAFYRQHCVVSSSSSSSNSCSNNNNSSSSCSSSSSGCSSSSSSGGSCSYVEEEKDQGEERADGKVKKKEKEEEDILRPSVNGRLLIICEDGMLSCSAALSLLLSHYHTSIDFSTRIPCPMSAPPISSSSSSSASTTVCGRVRQGQGERHEQGCAVRVPSRSKEEIRMCLAALQMHVPFADQLPRRLVKELNMFFTSTSISTSAYTHKLKH